MNKKKQSVSTKDQIFALIVPLESSNNKSIKGSPSRDTLILNLLHIRKLETNSPSFRFAILVVFNFKIFFLRIIGEHA